MYCTCLYTFINKAIILLHQWPPKHQSVFEKKMLLVIFDFETTFIKCFLKYYFLLSLFVDDEPSLDFLWLSTGPDVSALRLTAFLSIFDCLEFSDLYGAIEDSLLAALCLITHIVLQVVSAWLSNKFIEVLFEYLYNHATG